MKRDTELCDVAEATFYCDCCDAPCFNFRALVFFESYLLKLCISFMTPVLELEEALWVLER